jgi:hypothetical protein
MMKKAIMFIFALVLISGVVAVDFPPTPSAFYGTAKDTNGGDLPDGYVITAELNGVVSGICTVRDGAYGYGSDPLIALSPDQIGGTVKFYVNGKETEEDAEFIDMGVTELDLTVSSPPPLPGNCGDGACEADECSFCLIDCDIAKTNACIGNGRCDPEIGETCSNSEVDCGSCTTNNNNNNQDTGSGGPSGGGGGTTRNNDDKDTTPSSTSTTNTNTNSDGGEDNNPDSGLGILETEQKTSGITGAITGLFRTGRGIGVIIFIIAIIAIAIFVFVVRKREKLKT